MRDAGVPAQDIIRAVGRSRAEVYKIIQVEVPVWVKTAGLTEDFRDMARDTDEFTAASHCRALKRAMVAPL